MAVLVAISGHRRSILAERSQDERCCFECGGQPKSPSSGRYPERSRSGAERAGLGIGASDPPHRPAKSTLIARYFKGSHGSALARPWDAASQQLHSLKRSKKRERTKYVGRI